MSNVIPIISITTSEMEQAYEMCYMGGHPKRKNPIFISEPGAGKSWMTRNIFAQHVADCRTAKDGIARELSLFNANPPKGVFGVVPLNLGTSEPTDIGVPAIWWNGDDPIQKRAVYEALPRSGEGLLIVDEATQVQAMQKVYAQLVEHRRIGDDYVLPDGWEIVACGNGSAHKAGSSQILTHTANRLVIYNVRADAEGFLRVNQGNLADEVIAMMRFYPEMVSTFFEPKGKGDLQHASGRSWEAMSDLMLHGGCDPVRGTNVDKATVWGAIGSIAGQEFWSVCRCVVDYDIEGMLTDPESHMDAIQTLGDRNETMKRASLAVRLAKRTKTAKKGADMEQLVGNCIRLFDLMGGDYTQAFVSLAFNVNPDVADTDAYGGHELRRNENGSNF